MCLHDAETRGSVGVPRGYSTTVCSIWVEGDGLIVVRMCEPRTFLSTDRPPRHIRPIGLVTQETFRCLRRHVSRPIAAMFQFYWVFGCDFVQVWLASWHDIRRSRSNTRVNAHTPNLYRQRCQIRMARSK